MIEILFWIALAILVATSNANGEAFDATELIEGLPTNRFYINGTWVDSATDRFLEVIDPSTASVVASLAVAGPKEVDAAVTAAKEAWPSWAFDTSPEERESLVENLIRVYSSKIEQMALLVSTEMGSPIDAARGTHALGGLNDIQTALDMMEDFEFERSLPNIHPEEMLTTILYEPIGMDAGGIPA